MAKHSSNAKFIIKRKIYQGLKVGTIIFRKDSKKECKEFKLNSKKKNNIKYHIKLAKRKNSTKKDNKTRPIINKINKSSLTHSQKRQ